MSHVDPSSEPTDDGAPAGQAGALRQAQQELEQAFGEECAAVASQYDLTEDEAREALLGYDDLLHLLRHGQGHERLAALGAKAGAFLLDRLKAIAPDDHEHCAPFVTEALCECLSTEVESRLRDLLGNRATPMQLQSYAIVALAHGKEEASRDLLAGRFCEMMERDRGDREPSTYPALVMAMLRLKDPRAVGGLTRLIAEERRSSSTEMVVGAIQALGEIGDKRAIPPLRKLVKNRDRWALWPHACLALAHLGDEKVRPLADKARGKIYQWTAWQLEVFDQIDKLAPPAEEDAKKSKKSKTAPDQKDQTGDGDSKNEGAPDAK